MDTIQIEFIGVKAQAPGHNQIVIHHGDNHIVLSPCKAYEKATHAIVCDYDKDDWIAWKWYVDRKIPLYAEGAICEALKHEEIGKHLIPFTKPIKIGDLRLHVLKAPVAPRQPAAGVMLPQFKVCIVPELPPYISQALIKAFGYPPKHIIVGIGSYEKPNHKISFKDFKEQIKRVLQPPEKGILSLTLTNFRKDLVAHKSTVLKELKKIFPDIPIIWAKKGMVFEIGRDGQPFEIIKGKSLSCPLQRSIRKLLHLEEFRKEGIDYDLEHPEERWRQLIADLRYCLPKGSLVLLADGRVRPVEKIEVKDKLYAGSPTQILRIYRRKAKEKLVKIKAFGLPPVYLTENHPVLVCESREYSWCRRRLEDIAEKFKENPRFGRKIYRNGQCKAIFYDTNKIYWKPAKELRKEDLVCVPLPVRKQIDKIDLLDYLSDWKEAEDGRLLYKPQKPGEHYLSFPCRFLPLNKKLGYIIGLWLAEGDLDSRSGLRLSLNEKETKLAIDFLNYIEEIFGLKGRIIHQPEKHSLTVRVHSKPLAGLFDKWCGHGAHNKFLPVFAFNAPRDFKLALLDGLFKGDGTNTWGDKKYNSRRLGLTSPSLVFGAWLLLLTLRQFGKISVNKKNVLELALRGDLNSVRSHKVFFTNNAVWIPIRDVSVLEYEGELFNYQTTANVYAVPFLVHNCGNSAYPRLKRGKKWGNWTLTDVKKYFAKIIDTLRSRCKFPWIPPFGKYKKIYKEYYGRDPNKAAKSSFWQLYKEAEKYMQTKPPATLEEAKEWDKERKSIIKTKSSLKPGWYSDVKPKYRFEIDIIESDLAHLGWDKKTLLVDPKWDGLRLTLGKIDGKGFAWVDPEDLKERSPDVTDRVPEIIKEIETYWPDNTICDAELITMDFPEVLHRTVTNAVLRTKEPAENFIDYVYAAVFDIMYFKGEEVEHEPLKKRMKILKEIPLSAHIIVERVSKRLEPGGFAYICNNPKEVRQAWNLIINDKAVKFRGKYIRKGAEGVMIKLWEEDTRAKQQNPAWSKTKIFRECDLVVLGKHTVKGTTSVFNYYLGIDITPEYAAKLLDDKKLKKWVVALDEKGKLITGVTNIRNLLKKKAKVRYFIYYGKSDNTKIKLDVGDVLRVASEEVIRYENEAHPEAPLFRGYINRAMEPIPEKNVSDSLDVFNRLSLLEPKRVPIEELMRWHQESIKEKKFKGRGLYLPAPHAELIYAGKKVLVLKDRKYNIGGEVFLIFDHDKAYGYAMLGKPIKINTKTEFINLQPLHKVTEEEFKKYKWKLPVYAYPVVQFMPFSRPKKMKVPRGVQNFLLDAADYIVEESSLPPIAFLGERPVEILEKKTD